MVDVRAFSSLIPVKLCCLIVDLFFPLEIFLRILMGVYLGFAGEESVCMAGDVFSGFPWETKLCL